MKEFTYALYTEPTMDNDLADWFDDLQSAMDAARAAIDNGVAPENVQVLKLYVDGGECAWDFGIEFDSQGRAWSDGYAERDEMGFIQ